MTISIRLQSLRREFMTFRMKDFEFVKDNFSSVIEIVNQMKTYGEDVFFIYKKIVHKF